MRIYVWTTLNTTEYFGSSARPTSIKQELSNDEMKDEAMQVSSNSLNSTAKTPSQSKQ